MSRTIDEEKEALRKAAEAVRPVLEKLEGMRAKLDVRIARLRAVIDASDSNKDHKTTIESSSAANREQTKIPRGQVGSHVRAILMEGGDYTEPELRRKIAEHFRVEYSRPAVYSALMRGKKNGEYENKQRRWRTVDIPVRTRMI